MDALCCAAGAALLGAGLGRDQAPASGAVGPHAAGLHVALAAGTPVSLCLCPLRLLDGTRGAGGTREERLAKMQFNPVAIVPATALRAKLNRLPPQPSSPTTPACHHIARHGMASFWPPQIRLIGTRVPLPLPHSSSLASHGGPRVCDTPTRPNLHASCSPQAGYMKSPLTPAGEARPRWMYIPRPLRAPPGSLAPSRLEKPVGRHASGSLARSVSASRRLVIGRLGRRDLDSEGHLQRRQFSGNPADNTNAQIGIVVGVVLGVFLLGLCVFLYIYRYSIKFSYRKRRSRRHKSSSSKSSKISKSSKSSDVGPPPPADAPPPPAPAEEGT
ncbi:Uncharacterized protein TCAP_00602 [Tolypocladium capitatum]|uniref:Uncharacterized protein n=1 Tax=Tolypocladium capitatum TaxID=45235 RepID=A0A2K3QPP1_9HYPO|nr:Uncharacterized protein TCAP_00602 [Tolypocladium capitatum]